MAETQDPAKECGRVVLFIGIECQSWSVAQFAEVAKFARAHGIDSLCAKRADGGIRWYKDTDTLKAEREAVLKQGVGYIPFSYLYGPHFRDPRDGAIPGASQIRDEVAILAEMMAANDGAVCADLEDQWFGQHDSAAYFCSLMLPVPGLLYLTTYADPITVGMPIRQLAPCVNAWVPQDYSNWLAAQEAQQVSVGMSVCFPAFDLTSEFGPNSAPENANRAKVRGHQSIWLWEYGPATQNPALLDATVKAFKG